MRLPFSCGQVSNCRLILTEDECSSLYLSCSCLIPYTYTLIYYEALIMGDDWEKENRNDLGTDSP